MAQLRDNWISAQDMVRSRAWREGYEAFRRGEPLDFAGPKSKTLAYEYGRFTAAYLKAEGERLPLITSRRPINEAHVDRMAAAMLTVLASLPDDG